MFCFSTPIFYSLTHTHNLSPSTFFCLMYLLFMSPWPFLLSVLWSFSQRPARADRKRGLLWVWAHRCNVYCPNLRELASKTPSTKSRASEPAEAAGGGRGSKTGPDWVVYLFSAGCGCCQQAERRSEGWRECELYWSDCCKDTTHSSNCALCTSSCSPITHSLCQCRNDLIRQDLVDTFLHLLKFMIQHFLSSNSQL